jgi:hypothetical protein
MADSSKAISQAIKKADADLREKYGFLKYQDAIGAAIFVGSFCGIFATWHYYSKHGNSYIHCAVIIVAISLFTSLLHELEHDLIHNLYFKKSANKPSYAQDFMFFCIWISKLHGNPWYRRELHLKHHIISGQTDDAEERLIGLGLPFSWTRMAVTMHPFGSLIVTPSVAKDAAWLDVQKLNLTSAPVAFLFFGLNKIWMLYVGVMLCVGYENYHHYLPAHHWWWIRASAVCVCLPNMWRQACLVAMSNCSHYYGDIPEKSVFYQNQILDHPVFHICNLFCFNFGATHIVHHYVPGQPFYIRELVYRRVKSFMVENGVRLNDFGVVARGNRYFDPLPLSAAEKKEDKMPTSVTGADDGAPIAGRTISPNGSNMGAMILWLGLCFTVGAASYAVFDQWQTAYLGSRIFRKYLSKHRAKAE